MQKIYTNSLLAIMLLLTSFASQQAPTGKEIYTNKCIRCHGADGTKRFLGAKNLQRSKLDEATIALIIQNGKGFMPSYKAKLTSEEINQVIVFVKNMQK